VNGLPVKTQAEVETAVLRDIEIPYLEGQNWENLDAGPSTIGRV